MATTSAQPRSLRPFTIIAFSVADAIVCPECLRTSVPVTGERVSHTCRRNRAHVTDHTRSLILELSLAHARPRKIAEDLKVSLATVMRVISGDADDDASCPACEAGRRTESCALIPIYAGDRTMTDERCTHCDRNLLEVARERLRSIETNTAPEYLVTDGFPSLRFPARPSASILQALKAAGWRWHPRDRIWFDPSKTAAIPEGIPVPPPAPTITPKPPNIRRRAALTA